MKWSKEKPAKKVKESRPARGAWIEISLATRTKKTRNVAPREGRVD